MRLSVVVVLISVAAVLGACGSDDSGGGGGNSGQPATLKVGVIPIADVAPLYLGIKQGYFKQEKLTIKPRPAEGGAAIVAATVAGDDQIGFSNTTSLLIANSKNVPVKLIAQGVAGAAKVSGAWDAVLVKKGSTLTPKDLEGKTVAVNTL